MVKKNPTDWQPHSITDSHAVSTSICDQPGFMKAAKGIPPKMMYTSSRAINLREMRLYDKGLTKMEGSSENSNEKMMPKTGMIMAVFCSDMY